MKKVSLILLSILVCLPIISFGQLAKQDSSLKDRNFQQQLFASEYIKKYEPENGFDAPNQVLLFMKALSEQWQQIVSNQSEVYKQFNTYVSMWAVYTLFSNELPAGSKCLVYSEIALPSFVKDVTFMKEQLQNEKADLTEAAYLIRHSNLNWATIQPPTFKCDLKAEQWESLKEAVAIYPGIIQKYLDAKAFPEIKTEDYRQSYQRVLSKANTVEPFINLLDKIYKDELSDVFASLAANLPGSNNYRYIYVEIGKRLYQKYKDKNQTDLALATLDLLARNTSNATLARRELRSMYEQTDPKLGPARFESINSSDSGSLVAAKKQEALSGKFFNATSGEYVQLSSYDSPFIVLDFWSMTCGPCIEEIPRLNNLAKKYDEKFELVSINSDLSYSSKEKIQEFVDKHNIEYPVLLDTEKQAMMEQFNIGGWPTRFLLGKNGSYYMDPAEKRIKLSLNEIENFLKER